MEKIARVLQQKNHLFNYISDRCYVSDALSKMTSQNFEYLVVMGDADEYKGLISEHDIIKKGINLNRPLTVIRVNEIMNTSMPSADVENSVEECMKLMRLHGTRYLPVFDVHAFVGILSMEDLLQEAISAKGRVFDAEPVKNPVLD